MEKRVLILSEAFGTGHTTVAISLMQSIQHIDPSVEIRVLEVMKDFRPFTSKLLNFTYLTIIRFYPSIWRKLYIKRQAKPYPRWNSYLLFFLLYNEMKGLIKEFNPHVVVCTHPFANAIAAMFKYYGHKFTLCTLITDLHFHGSWICPEIDHYLVTCKDIHVNLPEEICPSDRLLVTGMPTRPGFWKKEDKKKVRQELKIRNIPTILVMGGGLGLGEIEKVARSLIHLIDLFQLVLCTGNNDSLKKSLESSKTFQHPNVFIQGYTEMIDKWMDAADLLITKPGGSTCYEALIKALPIVIFQPISGHEEKNCDYLIKNSLGTHIQNIEQLPLLIEEILLKPQKSQKFMSSIQKYKDEIDPLESAKAILNLIS